MPGAQWLEWRRSSAATSAGSGNGNGSARGRVVGQVGVLRQAVDGVEAEPVGALVEPEPDDVLHRLDDRGIPPVEVGLLGEERVQVPAAGGGVPRPRRPAERRPPVVRPGVGPDVAVGVLAKPADARSTCDTGRGRAGARCRERGPPRRAPGRRRPCRGAGRRREVRDVVAAVGERRRIERLRARSRRRRARRCGRCARRSRAGRRCRRRRSPGTSADRSGRRPRSRQSRATTGSDPNVAWSRSFPGTFAD